MAKEYRAEQFLSLTGSECGTEIEILQVVKFTVDPGCAETRMTPAEPATVDDIVIRHFIGIREITLPARIAIDFEESREFKAWLLECANKAEQPIVDDAADCEPDEFTGFSRDVLDTVARDTARV